MKINQHRFTTDPTTRSTARPIPTNGGLPDLDVSKPFGEDPSTKGLHYRVVLVTPAIAQRLLDINDGNRAKKPLKIDQYKRDMLNGAWPLTGENVLVVDSEGKLRGGPAGQELD